VRRGRLGRSARPHPAATHAGEVRRAVRGREPIGRRRQHRRRLRGEGARRRTHAPGRYGQLECDQCVPLHHAELRRGARFPGDLAIDSMTTTWPHAASGSVRAIAVTTPQRSATAPDLPTIGETLTGYEATAWQGLFAPAGTPRPTVDKIAAEVRRVWNLPEVV